MSPIVKKIIGLAVAALLIIVLYNLYYKVEDTINVPVNNKVIVIDAGHGGRDAGASGKSGLKEKDVNLEIAKRLRKYVEDGGGVAIMIREEDNGLYSIESPNKKREDMKNRKQIILDSNADLFISIHLNSFPQSQYYGAQVFYPEDCEISAHFARVVQQELIRVLDRNNNRVEKSSDDYFILKDNGIPSILIECGFLSNPEEERLLGQNEYQEKIAWSIYIGILKFITQPKPVQD